MEPRTLPETIQTIIEQAGGFGLAGAFAYVGAQRFVYRCPCPTGECRPDHPSKLTTGDPKPFVQFEVGITCRVNGKRGRNWTLIIAYEPNDTYTVWLVEGHERRTADTMVLACKRDVYCDTLRSTIECAYDTAIQDHNRGFIPLG